MVLVDFFAATEPAMSSIFPLNSCLGLVALPVGRLGSVRFAVLVFFGL